MNSEFGGSHRGSCLPTVGMARQSVAAGGRGGHLKSVPDATHPPTQASSRCWQKPRFLWLALGSGSPVPPAPQPAEGRL